MDRRFYRRKYEAARTVSAFGATLRDGAYADLGSVGQRLVEVVQETMQPSQAWLWLRPVMSNERPPAPPSGTSVAGE